MAETTTVIVKFQVEDGDIDQFASKITSLNGQIDKTASTAAASGKSLNKTFDSASGAADNLKGGVGGIATQFGTVAKAAKAGGAAMKSALISTGIGIIVVALGEIVANWDAISDAISGANEKLAIQKQLTVDINKELERQKFLRESGKELIDNETKESILRAKIAGASEEDIFKIKEQGANKTVGLLQEQADEANRILQNSVGAEESTYLKAQEAQIAAFKNLGDARAGLLQLQLEEELRIRNESNKKAPTTKREKDRVLGSDLLSNEEDQAELDKLSQRFERQFELQQIQEDALNALKENSLKVTKNIANEEGVVNAKKALDDEAYAALRVKIAEEEAKTKLMLLDSVSQGLSSASEIVGKETAAGKALAVASSLINTYTAIAGQLAAFSGVPVPGYAIVQAVATGLAGFAAVKNILSVKVPNSGGGGATANTGGFSPSGGAAAPSFNVVGASPVNQIAESLNAQQNPIQAYVVSGEVTSQQELDRNIQNTATIG